MAGHKTTLVVPTGGPIHARLGMRLLRSLLGDQSECGCSLLTTASDWERGYKIEKLTVRQIFLESNPSNLRFIT